MYRLIINAVFSGSCRIALKRPCTKGPDRCHRRLNQAPYDRFSHCIARLRLAWGVLQLQMIMVTHQNVVCESVLLRHIDSQ